MESTKENEVTDSKVNRLDNLLTGLFSLMKTLGPWGAGLSTAISSYLTAKRFARIEEMLCTMGQKLNELPNKSVENIVTKDEFLHICVSAMEMVQKEHRQRKRRYFGSLLANVAADEDFEFELVHHFLSLLDLADEVHIAILDMLGSKGVKSRDDEGWTPFVDIQDMLDRRSFRQPQELIRVKLEDLARFGVIKTAENSGSIMFGINPVGIWYKSDFSITDTGLRFLEYVDCQTDYGSTTSD